MDTVEVQDIPNAIEQAGSVQKIVENLFYGWGYNAYRKENQLRADDLLVRSRLSDLLGQCRKVIKNREMDWRREHLPAPTREHPYPDPDAVRAARSMERFGQEIEAVESLIRTAPVPENDRVWQRHRNEKDTLEKLYACDIRMGEEIITLLQACESAPINTLSTAAIRESLQNRNAIIL